MTTTENFRFILWCNSKDLRLALEYEYSIFHDLLGSDTPAFNTFCKYVWDNSSVHEIDCETDNLDYGFTLYFKPQKFYLDIKYIRNFFCDMSKRMRDKGFMAMDALYPSTFPGFTEIPMEEYFLENSSDEDEDEVIMIDNERKMEKLFTRNYK